MSTILAWLRKNPNKLGVILWAVYSWLKAVARVRFHYDFLAETDAMIMTALTALGLHSVTRKVKKP